MSKRRRQPTSQSDLFVVEPTVPEGFLYRDDVITLEEEQALIERFRELPFKPFEFHGFLAWSLLDGATISRVPCCSQVIRFHPSCFHCGSMPRFSPTFRLARCSKS